MMNPHYLKKLRLVPSLCLVTVLGLSACSTPGGQADGRPFDLEQVSAQRAELTTTVKAALVADERVSAASIQVVLVETSQRTSDDTSSKSGKLDAVDMQEPAAESQGQSLRLEGFVGDVAERAAAIEIANTASEGVEVINALEIRN